MFDPDSGDINFDELLEFFLQHLHHQILPFWMNHCVDHIHGGINNCVRDDGKVISTEKYLWSQGRALWVFSHLFNAHDKDPKWLELAKPIAQMLLEHGRNDKGEWFFSLQADGSRTLANTYRNFVGHTQYKSECSKTHWKHLHILRNTA